MIVWLLLLSVFCFVFYVIYLYGKLRNARSAARSEYLAAQYAAVMRRYPDLEPTRQSSTARNSHQITPGASARPRQPGVDRALWAAPSSTVLVCWRSYPHEAQAAERPIRWAAGVTIQDLGSIGELIAAVATVATLVYLAAQVRQNTRALRSSTFQNISQQMAHNVEPIASHADVADILAKGLRSLAGLTPAERIRFQSVLVMSFRRMEAVYVHSELGSIDAELSRGFERSMLSMLHSPGGAQWWETAKVTFTRSFADHVDSWLAANEVSGVHPSMGFSLD